MRKIVICFYLSICFASFGLGQHVHLEDRPLQKGLLHHPSSESDAAGLVFDLSAAWESRYVSEGRDNLGGDSLASATLAASYAGVTVGTWLAESPDQDYTEYNYWIGYSYEWADFTFSIGYTYLDFASDDDDDQEYSGEVAYVLSRGFELVVGGYYSKESAGAFYEATLAKTVSLTEALELVPFGSIGFNDDYVVEGHQNWNHATIGVELTYEIYGAWAVSGFVAGNIGIDSDKDRYADDEALKDFVYGGLSLSFLY